MLGVGQWNEVVLPPSPTPLIWWGDRTEDPIFQRGTVVAKFPHQAIFRDENLISATEGIEKGYPGGSWLVVASFSLFTLLSRGTEPVDPQTYHLQVYHRGL